MIGVIPNPKKTFQVEKPIAEVYQAIEHLPLFTKKYNLFKKNRTLNQFTFDALEFLSMGVNIDINCNTISDNRTEVVIEVKRKIGSFDKSYEVSKANTHISDLTDLISKSIETPDSERFGKIEAIAKEKRDKEETEKQKNEEIRLRNEERKKNNPVKYYTGQVIGWTILATVIGAIWYGMYKLVVHM